MQPRSMCIVSVLGVAVIARVAAAWMLGDRFFAPDETVYLDAAGRLLDGEGFASTYGSVPAYPVVLALLALFLPLDLLRLRIAQGVFCGLGVLLFWIWSRYVTRVEVLRTALLFAMFFYSLDPLLVITGGLLYPESVTAVLMLSVAITALVAARGGRMLASASAGLLAGLLALLRPVALVATPVLVIWLAYYVPGSPRRRMAHVGVLLLIFLATLTPWTYWNYVVHQRFMPISTQGAHLVGETRSEISIPEVMKTMATGAGSDPAKTARRFWQEFLGFWEFYPTRLVMDLPAARASFHALDDRLPLRQQFPPGIRAVVSAVSFGAELSLAVVGILAGWRRYRRETLLLLGLILAFACGYALIFGKLRYRIPILPLLFVFSGAGASVILGGLFRGLRTSPQDSQPETDA